MSNPYLPADCTIDPATEGDVPVLLRFIRELAAYEREPYAVRASEESLRRSMFGGRRYAEALIVRRAGSPVGFAVFFHNFSTWLGRPGLYLEDLYVTPPARGSGLGKALLVELARIARDRDCGRLEWWVLDWNDPAIRFYRKLGARPMDDWTVYRLTRDGIDSLAGGGPAAPAE